MRHARWWPLVVVAFALTIASTAQTASNTVDATKAEDDTRAITANDLKPAECAAMTLTAKVTGSGTINGTSAAELITGSAVVDNFNGGFGTDCIVGGAGDDAFIGGGGVDVCIGGAGTDTFSSCETMIQ